MDNIGTRIKNRRIELNMTQDELAKKIGYTSKSTIARIESGSNQLKQNKILDFAEALNTTPSYLIGWNEKERIIVETQSKPTNEQALVLYLLSLLNNEGYNEAVKRIEELTQLDKYKRDNV